MSMVLVTGGCGYIGSHTVLALLEAGRDVVVLDNLSNSSEVALARVQTLTGRKATFIKGDIRDTTLLDTLFSDHSIDAVLHFAGLKAVGESVAKPLTYFDNNVVGTVSLCKAMVKAGVSKMVFSSSCTVYGPSAQMPVDESMALSEPASPYGRSKRMVEQILEDLAKGHAGFRVALLRYFNPVGAHESGLIGEDPQGIPNNLLPYISQVAVGRLQELSVFGSDYPTPDGTGIRDYIHVVDLAQGHLAALDALENLSGVGIWNLGTGQGVSVLEMIRAFEQASGKTIAYRMVPRRAGDVACVFANPEKAQRELGWSAKRTLAQMMQDTWRWQSQNPNGYGALG